MRVEEVSHYGEPLGFPKEVERKQFGIVLSAMREKHGVLGMVPSIVRVLAEQRRIPPTEHLNK